MILLPYDDINPTRTIPFFTWLLIGLNVAAFVYLYILLLPSVGPEQVQALSRQYTGCVTDRLVNTIEQSAPVEQYLTFFFLEHGLVPRNIRLTEPQIENFLKSMFLHGSPAHLIGNMVFLWITADNLEDRFGHVYFLLFYVFCGFVAAGAQIALSPTACVPMIGASGAIAGTMGAYMVLFPTSKIKVFYFLIFPFFGWFLISAYVWLGLWIASQFLFEYLSSSPGGVAYAAHIGGFVAGMSIALVGRFAGYVEGGVKKTSPSPHHRHPSSRR